MFGFLCDLIYLGYRFCYWDLDECYSIVILGIVKFYMYRLKGGRFWCWWFVEFFNFFENCFVFRFE